MAGDSSQRALADDLGISKSLISQYERGESEPTLSVLIKIARYFGCSLDDITDKDLSMYEYHEPDRSTVKEPDGEYNKLKIENQTLREALREIGKGIKH